MSPNRWCGRRQQASQTVSARETVGPSPRLMAAGGKIIESRELTVEISSDRPEGFFFFGQLEA